VSDHGVAAHAGQRGGDEAREHLNHALAGIEQVDVAQRSAARIQQQPVDGLPDCNIGQL